MAVESEPREPREPRQPIAADQRHRSHSRCELYLTLAAFSKDILRAATRMTRRATGREKICDFGFAVLKWDAYRTHPP